MQYSNLHLRSLIHTLASEVKCLRDLSNELNTFKRIHKAKARARYKADPKIKASVRDSYKADPEKKKASLKGRSRKQKASVRDSYKADPEKKKASVRDSYKADPEKKASVRDSYKADPEKKKASVRNSYKADPEKKAARAVRNSYNPDIESKQSAKKQRYQEDLEEKCAAKSQKYEDNSAAIRASERNRSARAAVSKIGADALVSKALSVRRAKAGSLLKTIREVNALKLEENDILVAGSLPPRPLDAVLPPYRPPPAVAAELPPAAAAELPHRQQKQQEHRYLNQPYYRHQYWHQCPHPHFTCCHPGRCHHHPHGSHGWN
eukprot:Em0027g58a